MEQYTLREIYLRWKDAKRMLVKESTLATYMIHAEKYILPAMGDNRRITAGDVQALTFSMLGRRLSGRTVRSVLVVLKMIGTYGRRIGWDGWAGSSPLLPRDVVVPGVSVLTCDEQRRLMHYLRANFSTRNLGIYISLCTGMRIGEICGLRWSDIDIAAGLLHVRRTVERIYVPDGVRRYTKLTVGDPKTAASCRDIPITSALMSMLAPAGELVAADSYLLTGTPHPLEPRLLRRHYVLLMRRLGLPELKFHALRHTFATRCIESDCDFKTVSVLLGHSSVSTTLNLYVHPGLGQKQRCIDRMMQSVMDRLT